MSSDQGNANAQKNLGWMYAEGKGVPKDYAEAVKWYMKAADQGNAFAQHNLGLMYKNGNGVAKDRDGARKWFQKAADQGNEDAKKELQKLEFENHPFREFFGDEALKRMKKDSNK